MVSEPGRGRDGGGDDGGDDDLTAGPAPFSDEGMRRIIYGQDRDGGGPESARRPRDSRSDVFDEDTAELAADLRGRRSLVPIVTALAAVFCFGAIVWYAYTWGTGQMTSEELPVVRAEPMPEKVKPEQPGGMVVEHQSIEVLNPGATNESATRVERLLPRPEAPNPPEPLPIPPAPTAQALPEDRPPAGPPEAPLMAGESAADATEAPAMAEDAPAMPAGEAESPQMAEGMAEGGIAKPIPKPATGGNGTEGDQIAQLLDEPALETANGDASTPAQAPAAPAATPTDNQVAAVTAGDVVLQLSSVKSETAAAAEWKRLKAAHPGLLGSLPLTLETAEVKGTTYYRVQTGPFPSRSAAADVCSQLKARNQDCLVKQR